MIHRMAVSISSVHTERFHIPVGSCLFQAQFASIYLARLKSSKPRLIKLASERWPDLPFHSLAEVEPDKECIIIGTIFRVSFEYYPCNLNLKNKSNVFFSILVLSSKTKYYQTTCTVGRNWW